MFKNSLRQFPFLITPHLSDPYLSPVFYLLLCTNLKRNGDLNVSDLWKIRLLSLNGRKKVNLENSHLNLEISGTFAPLRITKDIALGWSSSRVCIGESVCFLCRSNALFYWRSNTCFYASLTLRIQDSLLFVLLSTEHIFSLFCNS